MKIGFRFVYDSHTFIEHPKSLDQREEQTDQHVQNIRGAIKKYQD